AGTSGSAGAGGSAGASGNAGAGGSAGASGNAGASGSAGASGNAGAGGSAGASGGAGTSSGEPATITPGAADRFLLIGRVVTPDTDYDGEVLVDGKMIACAEPGSACESHPRASGATVIDTHGIILPGLIDTHNHILFDVFDDDDWVPNIPTSCSTAADCNTGANNCKSNRCDCVDNRCRYQSHTQWTLEPEYGLMLDYKQCLEDASQGKPTWCPQKYDGAGMLRCELDKWGELKGLIAGTTSIVGLPGTGNTACLSSLARSIDIENGPEGKARIQTNVGTPPSKASAQSVCSNITSGTTQAYLTHLGEGTPASGAASEFATLGSLTDPVDCLYAPETTITHGVAFGAAEFQIMADHGMKLTWSPASNVALYGVTADIPLALSLGLTIALGPDWSMGGSQNMLDELRFANAWDDARFGDQLSAKALVVMATKNGAKALASEAYIGSIAAGLYADLFVIGGDTSKPYDAVLAARPKDVRLVMVGGAVLYGDAGLVAAAPAAPGCDTMNICGVSKFLCVATSSSANKLDQDYATLKGVLETAMTDLDAVAALPSASCASACGAGQACYPNTRFPKVPLADCTGGCPAGQLCYQTTSGGKKECLGENLCAPVKNRSFAPVAPLVRCD
ncbi:MAG: amidohydrolase family protein, partial [Sorangiineae bacterium]|nr:amidohydrolase family protein [Sorangiineae bacterium]